MAQLVLPEPGDIIGGKYRVESAIGRGGMGAVFEASHRVTNKRFAIKLLVVQTEDNDSVVSRFVREAQVAGRCEHPNIVEVYDIDREGSSFFMVMELLQGESLSERLARGGRLATRDVCRLLLPCMEAIGEAHAAGIIHRDLKPANIFVCRARGHEPELAKVLDFGVSRFASVPDTLEAVSTRSGAVIGTPFYMSPEQMRGQPIDTRVDVYSMGITLYEVLSGIRPYSADSYGDLLLKIAEAAPTALDVLVPELPAGLSDVVGRAMAYDRSERFPSMQALMEALAPYRQAEHRVDPSSVSFYRPSQPTHTPLVIETPVPLAKSSAGLRPSWRMTLGLALGLLLTAALVWRALRSEPQADVVSKPPATASGNSSAQATGTPSAATPQPAAFDREQPGDGSVQPASLEPLVHAAHAQPSATRANSRATRRAHASQLGAHRGEQAPEPDSTVRADHDGKPRRVKSRAPATLGREDF
jgi:eukaryotic-like serine/threonine-protein kinase